MKRELALFQGKTKKGKDIVIRYVTGKDLQTLHKYINAISKEQTYITFQGEEISLKEEKKYLTDFLKKIRQKEAVKLLVLHGEQLVALSDISLKEKTEKHVGVFGITVAKEYRGEGIGKLLMNLVIQEAKKAMPKLKIIQLGIFANNGIACSLYENLGFTRYGTLPKGILHKGQYVDHIYMYKAV